MAGHSKGLCAWLAGLFAAWLLLPASVHAQAKVQGCWLENGADSITFNVPPSVSFSTENPPISGTWLYLSRPYTFDYHCFSNSPVPQRPALMVGGDYAPVRQAMRDASLSLNIVYDSFDAGSWNPEPGAYGYAPYFPVGEPYVGDSGVRHAYIILLLVSTSRVTTPLRAFLPATHAFKLIAHDAAAADPGIWLNSTASRFQYIPRCIGLVTVDDAVAFDTVLTTTSHNGKLPQAKPFNLTSRINIPGCAGIEANLVAPPNSNSPLDEFYLRTAVSFLPQGTERIDMFDETLYLRNTDGEENGLALTITNAANQKIKFGAIPTDTRGVPSARYNTNLGPILHGTTLAATQTYTAHLERNGSVPLKTGNYRTQVLVQVAWY